MKKIEKPAFVTDIANKIKLAKSVVAVNFQGLDVKSITKLRDDIEEAGGNFQVVKNTLIKLALEEAGAVEKDQLDPNGELLSGPTALVYANDDEIAPLQLLGKATATTSLKLKFGVFVADKRSDFYDANKLSTLSKLPNKEILRGKVVGTLLSPLYGLVGSLRGNLQSLIYILNAKAQQG